MDYIIANIRITLPDAFVAGHFAHALAPFEVRKAEEDNRQAQNTGRTGTESIGGNAGCGEDVGVASYGGNAALCNVAKASGGHVPTLPANGAALVVTSGTVLPAQADHTELSFFDFPDADADCRFGRDSAGYLFVMTPRDGGAPASFRKEYATPAAVTDFTSEHNPALFRFGVWMMFNIVAAPLCATAVHSSVIACNGFGIMFLGESGTGKSTHTRLWREHIPGATLLNDDSPIVRISNAEADIPTGQDNPYSSSSFPQALVSGSPWSGKTPCYKNAILPIRAIVRLSQAPENRIRRLASIEAIGALLPSCPPAFTHDETLQDAVCATISAVLSQVPAYHLACLPDAAAARLAYATVFGKGAEKTGTANQPKRDGKTSPAHSAEESGDSTPAGASSDRGANSGQAGFSGRGTSIGHKAFSGQEVSSDHGVSIGQKISSRSRTASGQGTSSGQGADERTEMHATGDTLRADTPCDTRISPSGPCTSSSGTRISPSDAATRPSGACSDDVHPHRTK